MIEKWKIKTLCRPFRKTVSNEDGAVLLITVVIMLLLTLLGVSGINTASTDMQITKNYRVYKQNLALADAAVNQAKKLITSGQADVTFSWVNNISNLYGGGSGSGYFKRGTVWATDSNTPVINEIDVKAVIAAWDTGTNPAIAPTNLSTAEPNTQYVVYMNLNSPTNDSVVIARSRKNGGDVVIEAGFNTAPASP